MTKFRDNDVIHAKIMAIFSTGASGISNVFYRNLKKKETAVILKHIYQLPQNLASVLNLIGSFDRSHKNSNFLFFLLFSLFSIVHLLSVFCSNFDTPSEVQGAH